MRGGAGPGGAGRRTGRQPARRTAAKSDEHSARSAPNAPPGPRRRASARTAAAARCHRPRGRAAWRRTTASPSARSNPRSRPPLMGADANDAMPWFTKYVEGLVKSVNVLFHERTRAKQATQRKPSSSASSASSSSLVPPARRSRKRPRSSLAVTCCTGRAIAGQQAHLDAATRLAEEAAANFTEDDFRSPPTVAYPKAREVSQVLSPFGA